MNSVLNQEGTFYYFLKVTELLVSSSRKQLIFPWLFHTIKEYAIHKQIIFIVVRIILPHVLNILRQLEYRWLEIITTFKEQPLN